MFVILALKFLVLFQYNRECLQFCFRRQLTHLGSDHRFLPSFCGQWYHCQCSFQSLQTYLAWSHVYATHSVSSLGLVWLFISSVLRVCCLLFSVRSTHSVVLSLLSLQYFWFIWFHPFSVSGANQQKDRKRGKASKVRHTLLRLLLL